MRWAVAAVVLALVLGFATAARGDGAFPNAQSVLLPADRPSQIIVATTFGLVFSEDDGATWRYACESAATLNGRQYVVGPPPNDRIYGVSDPGVAVSADSTCTWAVGGGALAGLPALDVFPDPSDSNVAFALALGLVDGLVSAYRSHDGGLSYEGPLFTAPADGQVTGIEPAASAAGIVYLTIGGPHPALARSVDGGATWTTRNIDLALAGNASFVPSLAAVDPTDAGRVYLRITSAPGDPNTFEGLAVTSDGGTTWRVPLFILSGSLSGFVRLDGALFAVGTRVAPDPGALPQPAAFRSDDGGETFTMFPLAVHAVGLGQRNGVLFAATNTADDGFALASSADRGSSWQPRLRLADIAGVRDCVRATCADSCEMLASARLFAPSACRASSDAAAADGVAVPPASGGGCSCELAFQPAAIGGWVAGAVALLPVVWTAASGTTRRDRSSARRRSRAKRRSP